MVRNAYLIGHTLDINGLVLHHAECAIDAGRVGAYANGYHGNSWVFQVLRIHEFAGLYESFLGVILLHYHVDHF